jgi:hypothetical protein
MMKLELTIQEINTILQALGNGPFVQVADLIQKIKTQAEEQIAKSQGQENSSVDQ